MAIDVRVIPQNDFLKIVVSGAYDMQEAIDKFLYVFTTCRLTGLSKVCIDFSGLNGLPAAIEKMIYAFGIKDHYNKYIAMGGQKLMIAYVGNKPFVSDYEPGLKIVKDANMPFELFTNITEAYKWLGVKASQQVAGEPSP